MRFYYGTDNRETHAEAVVLRREKLFEQTVAGFARDARAAVSHAYANRAFAIEFRRDFYFPTAARGVVHGIEGVAEQVDEHLLDLDRIALDLRQVVRQGGFHFARQNLSVWLHHVDDFPDGIVEIDPLPDGAAFLYCLPHGVDNFVGASPIGHDIDHDLVKGIRIDVSLLDEAHSRARIVHDRGERLI